MALPYNFGSATNADRNFFKQLQEDLQFLGGGVSLVNQALIDETPDSSTIYVANGAIIEGIEINDRKIHFVFEGPGDFSTPGRITVNGPIYFEGCTRLIWEGNNVVFEWGGNAGDPMFKLSRCQFCQFRNMYVTTGPGDPIESIFWLVSTTGGSQVMTGNVFSGIVIDGTSAGGLQYGWRLGVVDGSVPGSVDNGGNNDFNQFINCTVSNYDAVACSIEQTQSLNNTFRNFVYLANGIGECGVTTWENSGRGGSFIFHDGGGGGCEVAEFGLGQPDSPILIQGTQSENSNRFMATLSAASNFPVTVRNCRIDPGGSLAVDNQIIQFNHRGPLLVEGCQIGNAGVVALELNLGATGDCVAVAIGNTIYSSLENPFTANANGAWQAFANNVQRDSSGSDPVPFPVVIPVIVFDDLPAGMMVGGLAMVDDSNTTVIGAVIGGGGGDTVLAWFDGTDWKVAAA